MYNIRPQFADGKIYIRVIDMAHLLGLTEKYAQSLFRSCKTIINRNACIELGLAEYAALRKKKPAWDIEPLLDALETLRNGETYVYYPYPPATYQTQSTSNLANLTLDLRFETGKPANDAGFENEIEIESKTNPNLNQILTQILELNTQIIQLLTEN